MFNMLIEVKGVLNFAFYIFLIPSLIISVYLFIAEKKYRQLNNLPKGPGSAQFYAQPKPKKMAMIAIITLLIAFVLFILNVTVFK